MELYFLLEKEAKVYDKKNLYYIENTRFYQSYIDTLCQTLTRTLDFNNFERRDTSQMSYLDLLFD